MTSHTLQTSIEGQAAGVTILELLKWKFGEPQYYFVSSSPMDGYIELHNCHKSMQKTEMHNMYLRLQLQTNFK